MASVGNLLYGSGSPELSGFTVLFWLIGFGLVCGLIFATMWSLFTLTDLETDHVNPMDACRRLNKMAKLEFTTLVLLAVLLLIAQTWMLALCVLPAACFCAYKIATSEEGATGLVKPLEPARLYDDTKIFSDLAQCKQELFVKLAFYMVTFFGVLYHLLRVTIYFILPYIKSGLMNTFLRPFSSSKKT